MKKIPILFSTEMVQAILEDRKTQTRRIIKPQPVKDGLYWNYEGTRPNAKKNTGWYSSKDSPDQWLLFTWKNANPGDLIWVRESWRYAGGGPAEGEKFDHSVMMPYDFVFKADKGETGPWKPSMFMPREACRLVLQIKSIRVERLQDISEQDAKLEGAQGVFCKYIGDAWNQGYTSYVEGFKKLWISINGPESWEINPWVWVIDFTTDY